jgi:acyl carrier protein
MQEDISQAVKDFILLEFLPGEDPTELKDDTPLITGGILDSIATMKLVLFLEERYGVTLEAHEVDPEHLDTVATIAGLVRAKQSAVSR